MAKQIKKRSRNSSKHTVNKHNKPSIHPRNLHKGRYDIPSLCTSLPELALFVIKNPKGEDTINFSDPNAVKLLNKALLIYHYEIDYWDIPQGFLCPPIPSRADYIHHIADLLNKYKRTSSDRLNIQALDIGTGANMIYPIIGSQVYDWQFVASDIDPMSIKNAQLICDNNPTLTDRIKIKHQTNPKRIFKGIIKKTDLFDVTICNPPFHSSLEEAIASNQRKIKNLSYNKGNTRKECDNNVKKLSKSTSTNIDLNFGGQKAELWCDGGEIAFLKRMVYESAEFSKQVNWFSSLISKSENVSPLKHLLKKLKATQIKEIKMSHGQKTSRILAWSWHIFD